jgi:integrase/recombinase XerD
MKNSKQLLKYVQAFFQQYLSAHRNLSPNTVLSYRDTLKLFLAFVMKQTGKHATNLALEDLQAEVILAFLDDIELTRHNSVASRNLRLAALRTFFRYLVTQDPLHAGQYQRIVAIPLKKRSRQVMEYLEISEVKALLETIDCKSASGRRDYVLLSLLYNTGARVQEICDLRVADLRLDTSPVVTITGKGRKTRHVPLWPETAGLLHNYIKERGISDCSQMKLFVNARGEPLTRFGIRHIIQEKVKQASEKCRSLTYKRISPHTFRHATAMHMLQSGVDLAVIKSWLGHVNLETTHAYVEIDLEMKRKALSTCTVVDNPEKLGHIIEQNKDVISWLESL